MLCFNVENENQPTHSFMKKHSDKYYSINDCPVKKFTKNIFMLILLDYTFFMKERNHLSFCNHDNLALHIEAVNLAGREYEMVPAYSCVAQEVNLNCTNLAQDLGQAPEVSRPRRQAPVHNLIIFRVIIHLTIHNVL